MAVDPAAAANSDNYFVLGTMVTNAVAGADKVGDSIEFARLGKHLIIVNHRSSPVDISGVPASNTISQVPSAPGWLAAHSAVCQHLWNPNTI